jgi:lipopolysaccharide/colanic/teichoic acid biosynthesis glycosyltransferase
LGAVRLIGAPPGMGAAWRRRAASVHVPTNVAFAEPLGRAGRCFKRSLDIALGIFLLILTLPVLLLAALAIAMESSGPVIFRQPRVGARGRVFQVWKLRTMTAGAPDVAHRQYVSDYMQGKAERKDGLFKVVDDPRITRVGRFLRRTSIDELPQLWNVLRGDMSLVGPRPPTVFETELYEPRAWLRLQGRPGMTGLWQVSGRAVLDYQQMVDLDLAYWESWSPRLEVRILCRTLGAVVTTRGAG